MTSVSTTTINQPTATGPPLSALSNVNNTNVETSLNLPQELREPLRTYLTNRYRNENAWVFQCDMCKLYTPRPTLIYGKAYHLTCGAALLTQLIPQPVDTNDAVSNAALNPL